MILSFVAKSVNRPIGGAIAIYEFANGMRRRGHKVHLLHRPFPGWPVPAPADMSWCRFQDGIEHHLSDPFTVDDLPDADFVFDYDPTFPERVGLPLNFVQGTMTGQAAQELRMRNPCPKLCVARWLVELGASSGVPIEQLVHLPCGINPQKYRVRRPISSRSAQVAMLYHPHPLKGARTGLAALELVRDVIPELRAVLFGTSMPVEALPPWVDFMLSPPQDVIVDRIYNETSVFVSASNKEGFGLPALEAMASGCALVTTDNGGSAEYAVHDETALVCRPKDAATMAAHIVALLVDDERRERIVTNGLRLASTLTWDASAARLESALEAYGADPVRFGRPV